MSIVPSVLRFDELLFTVLLTSFASPSKIDNFFRCLIVEARLVVIVVVIVRGELTAAVGARRGAASRGLATHACPVRGYVLRKGVAVHDQPMLPAPRRYVCHWRSIYKIIKRFQKPARFFWNLFLIQTLFLLKTFFFSFPRNGRNLLKFILRFVTRLVVVPTNQNCRIQPEKTADSVILSSDVEVSIGFSAPLAIFFLGCKIY